MPIDLHEQVKTALDSIRDNPEVYSGKKSAKPLETLINDLKDSNPTKYKQYLNELNESAKKGNEKARELLGKIGEDAARERRGYETLNAAMYIPSLIAVASTAPAAVRGAKWLYHQVPAQIRRGADILFTIDGARNNLFSDNGWRKTLREFRNNNYWNGIKSSIGDALDLGGGIGLLRRGIHRINSIDFRNFVLASKLYSNINKTPSNSITDYINTQFISSKLNYGKNSGRLIHGGYQNRKGGFSNKVTGSFIENGELVPGNNPNASINYSWWNSDKPYAMGVGNKPWDIFIDISEKDIPNLIKVRDSSSPIGQWNGKSGFVLNSEYVTARRVPLQKATIWEFDPVIQTWNNTKYISNPASAKIKDIQILR